jgi:hypothetical protein
MIELAWEIVVLIEVVRIQKTRCDAWSAFIQATRSLFLFPPKYISMQFKTSKKPQDSFKLTVLK